jgi:hypothetical protein
MDLPAFYGEMLRGIRYEKFRVYAYRAKNIPELCGYIPQNLTDDRKGHVTIWYYRWADLERTDMVTAYAYQREGLDDAGARALVEEDLYKIGCRDMKLYMTCSWNHFAHVDSETLGAGFYKRLAALQEMTHIYFAGEMMNAPNIENCVAYSRFLADRYF